MLATFGIFFSTWTCWKHWKICRTLWFPHYKMSWLTKCLSTQKFLAVSLYALCFMLYAFVITYYAKAVNESFFFVLQMVVTTGQHLICSKIYVCCNNATQSHMYMYMYVLQFCNTAVYCTFCVSDPWPTTQLRTFPKTSCVTTTTSEHCKSFQRCEHIQQVHTAQFKS